MRCAVYVNGELYRNGDEKKHELGVDPCCGDEITLHDGRVGVVEKRRHNLAGRFLELYLTAEEPKRGRGRPRSTESEPEPAKEVKPAAAEPTNVFGRMV